MPCGLRPPLRESQQVPHGPLEARTWGAHARLQITEEPTRGSLHEVRWPGNLEKGPSTQQMTHAGRSVPVCGESDTLGMEAG